MRKQDNMKKIILTIFIIAMFTKLVLGQQPTQTVRGTIIDIDNQLPLIAATVIILDTDPTIGTISDEGGNFRFENIPIGRISLHVRYIGYESKTIPDIVVNSGKEVFLKIEMQESLILMDEVVVRAYENKGVALNDMSLVSALSISVEETGRYAGGFSDPARVVSNLAGVASNPDGGSSDIIVRGNSPKYMQWRLDGVEITSPYHFNDQNASFGALSALNNNLFANSDFYTGAFSSEYGNALSCVFDAKLRTGNNEKFEAALGAGIMGVDFTMEGPFKKGYAGSYLVNYRYSAISLINKLNLVDIPGVLDYQDAIFKVVLPTKKIGTFSFFGFGGLNGFLIEDLEPDFFDTPGGDENADISKDYDKGANLANLGMNHIFSINNCSFIETSLSYSASVMNDDLYNLNKIKKYDSNGVFLSDSVASRTLNFKSRIINSTYRGAIIYSNKINAKNKVQIGIKYALSIFDYEQSMFDNEVATLTKVTDFNKSVSSVNNFISWKHRLNDNITLVSGLHNANVTLNNKSRLEPRFAFNWKLGNTNSVHAGYGKHSTMESVHNYYAKVRQADGSVTEPNKNLDLLKADHYVLGYEKRITENLRSKVEVYYQNLYDLPVENNDTSYYATINEGIDYRYVDLVNKGTGKNYGIEFTGERFFDNSYYYLISGSVYNSIYKSLERIERNSQYNSNYLVNLLCGKEFKNFGKKRNRTLAINAKVFFRGGKKYIPLLRDNQGNVAVDPVKGRYWDYNKAYKNRIDDIFCLNFSISYKINKPSATHEIFLDLMNITNYTARLSEYYDESEPNSIGYVKQMGFFPNLMYRVYF